MNKEQLDLEFSKVAFKLSSRLVIDVDEVFLSQIEGGKDWLLQIVEKKFSTQAQFLNGSFLDEQYKTSMDENAFVLMIGKDYESCPVMHYAKKLSHRIYKTADEERVDFRLIGTALENRFWGDEEAIRFFSIGKNQCRLINLKLLVDYAADWMFKNHK